MGCTFISVDRYSREEPFTALNVDVRHHDNLYESLDAFVKGDLLERANAYHCDKCDKKVSVPSCSVPSVSFHTMCRLIQ